MAGSGYKLFAAGDVLSASDVNTYIMQQTVMVFASASARTTALSGVLAEGMVSYLKDVNTIEVYDGSAWVGATGDITGLTAGTGVSITSATGPVPTVGIDTAVVPQLASTNAFTANQTITGTGTAGSLLVNTGVAGNKGLIVKGATSQTANLQEWQSSTAAVTARISPAGEFYSTDGYLSYFSTSTSYTATVNVQPAATTYAGITIRGRASQTADLQQWQNSAGTVLISISSGGDLLGNSSLTQAARFRYFDNPNVAGAYIDTLISTGTLGVVARSTTAATFAVRAVASQTGNLQEWRDSSGNVLGKIDASGFIYSGRVLTTNGYAALREINSGGFLQLVRQNAAGPNLGSNIGALYLRDGTTAGTLKLVVRAGAAGAETTILDNIPQ